MGASRSARDHRRRIRNCRQKGGARAPRRRHGRETASLGGALTSPNPTFRGGKRPRKWMSARRPRAPGPRGAAPRPKTCTLDADSRSRKRGKIAGERRCRPATPPTQINMAGHRNEIGAFPRDPTRNWSDFATSISTGARYFSKGAGSRGEALRAVWPAAHTRLVIHGGGECELTTTRAGGRIEGRKDEDGSEDFINLR